MFIFSGAGAYRSDDNKPYVLEAVRAAEEMLFKDNLDHEYSEIGGNSDFLAKALEFSYGKDAEVLQSNRVTAVQTISGTGALRLAAEFLSRFGSSRDVYMPDPTWASHPNLMMHGGLNPLRYRYYDRATKSFDYKGMRDDIYSSPPRSIILLHACAHNPTGTTGCKRKAESRLLYNMSC